MENPPAIVIANGPARIGKTTMQNHLLSTYGNNKVALVEPSRALKTHFMTNHVHPQSAYGFKDDGLAYIEYMKQTQKHWLIEYEKEKSSGGISREQMILYAESIRAVAPAFFVYLAIRMANVSPSTKLIWSEAINPQEYLEVRKVLSMSFPLARISLIRLNCLNPYEEIEGDTRSKIPNPDIIVTYALEDSRKVAEHLYVATGAANCVS